VKRSPPTTAIPTFGWPTTWAGRTHQRLRGMEGKSASLGKKLTTIIVQQNLVKFVRAATEGEAFDAATTNAQLAEPKLAPETMESYKDCPPRLP
jgi:hypothetical protein